MQYVASKRNRTPAQKAQLREYLDQHYPEGKSKPTAFTQKVKSAGLGAEDMAVLSRAQLASLEKSLPGLRERAAGGEDLSKAISWQQERIDALRKELSSAN